ncbi:MAG: DUF2264 domain-containing protein [Paludibacter sp.]|nr:DUF2264 domain-containing protein [Paludibacter sp.]
MTSKLKFISISMGLFLVFFTPCVNAADDKFKNSEQNIFKVIKPDSTISPFTGITRRHWKDAALYMLEGAFGYIHSLDDPMKFPKQDGKSYPRNDGQIPTEKLEGLCRTLFVAVPLLKDNPNLEINGIKVADYYRHQICNLVDPTSASYIKPRAKNGGPHQNLVEFGALSISLFSIPEVLWEPLKQAQKDALAATMLSYGDGPTVPSNWKFFNIFILSFYKQQGYSVNEKLLVEYLDKSLAHYRGEGWYNDNPAYDYYSMWAFQMYGVLWSEFFGNKYYPEYAQMFLKNFSDVKDNYPYMFSRDGKMIMWGRSISYRYGAVTPFPLMGFANTPNTNWGWMRRIASGTLLQFLQNPDFMKEGVPTLGFYGPFEPAVQGYSCRGSVYWGGKVFLGLLIPANNPFWTATENEGPWENQLTKDSVYNKFSKSTGILITDYPSIGASEIRAWCNVPVIGAGEPFRGSECYNRLSYNSAFPWQADGDKGEVSMNYVVKNSAGKWEPLRLYTFRKFENGIYYRDAVLETNRKIQFKLAEIPIPNGIIRVDKLICNDSTLKAVELRLGHYALPQLKQAIQNETFKIGYNEVKSIDNGEYKLAMIPWKRWGRMQFVHSTGLHPQSNASTVIDAFDMFECAKKKEKIYITVELWKCSGESWTNKEFKIVKGVENLNKENSIKLLMKDGKKIIVSFK